MTRRARHLLQYGLPAGLAVALIAAWLLWPRAAITCENAQRIEVGMTPGEVEAVLGAPAGDYAAPGAFACAGRCGDPMDARAAARPGPDEAGGMWQAWLSDDALIRVRFDVQDRVGETRVYPVVAAREGLIERFRRWLGL
jgi:hypothetical protein